MTSWNSKVLHGRFPNALQTSSPQQSITWLQTGGLFGETEGFMLAIQDQVIATRRGYYQKYIQKLAIENDTCRICRL